MVKHGFNRRWRDRDRAYKELPDAILEKLYAVISSLAEGHRPKRKMGRPLKVDLAKAAFLAVIKKHHREMPYRELAASRYVKWLGISTSPVGLNVSETQEGSIKTAKIQRHVSKIMPS